MVFYALSTRVCQVCLAETSSLSVNSPCTALHAIAVQHLQGKVLTNGIKAIHADFQAAVERFQVSRAIFLSQAVMARVRHVVDLAHHCYQHAHHILSAS
jgi:hypothetical protein